MADPGLGGAYGAQGTGHSALAAQGDSCANAAQPMGVVLEISGAGGLIALDLQRLSECASDADPCVAQSGLVGSQIRIIAGQTCLLATIRDQKQGRRGDEGIVARVDFLGEGALDPHSGALANFRRGVTQYPLPGALVYPAATRDLRHIYSGDGRAVVTVGKVHPTTTIRASLYIDSLLGKHFALLGSTGTGKSTALALILHRICELAPQGHILMIDPHGEYASAFRQTGLILDVSNLQLPYWLMNFEEHCEILVSSQGGNRQVDAEILGKCLLAARQKNRLAEALGGRITVDSPVPYLISDLQAILHNEMGKLEKATTTAPYVRLKTRIDELRGDPRFNFLFSGMLVGDTMVDVLSRMFRLPSAGQPIAIIDVSGVPSEVTSTVVALLSRLVFDFSIWAREEDTRPILLVCEEAHRYVPNEKHADGSSVGRILSRIAKEGRKYGVSLGLVTQRPSDLAEGVLSQCGTILSMRLNNERDQAFVRAAMPEGARGFLDAIPALRNRECIICGEGVGIPMRVSFDDLEESKRPASSDPSFSQLWRQSGDDHQMVMRTVQRWRTQGR
ncbi:ATP-binding protein [Novosphingobium sp. KACC 22771]|uniref:ATP-binding protein n=1 Tax=Novosphingobium sp. KACC 22771 TaxID=3025670 RepID=UPI002366EEC1|nr:DUF87 domain-containing protein [Novosphingobium sp. KACC 22771]WDF74105.1 DUF87 domain-containing protein [Novosphingobium sp. KACC 22771]